MEYAENPKKSKHPVAEKGIKSRQINCVYEI